MQWEYLRIKDATDDQLNAAGKEGWELITVVTPDSNILQIARLFIFKRPLK